MLYQRTLTIGQHSTWKYPVCLQVVCASYYRTHTHDMERLPSCKDRELSLNVIEDLMVCSNATTLRLVGPGRMVLFEDDCVPCHTLPELLTRLFRPWTVFALKVCRWPEFPNGEQDSCAGTCMSAMHSFRLACTQDINCSNTIPRFDPPKSRTQAGTFTARRTRPVGNPRSVSEHSIQFNGPAVRADQNLGRESKIPSPRFPPQRFPPPKREPKADSARSSPRIIMQQRQCASRGRKK